MASVDKKIDMVLTNAGEIYAIYILKEYQQRGIGKKLINFAVNDLINENYDKVVIWALKDNPNVKFYKKNRWK